MEFLIILIIIIALWIYIPKQLQNGEKKSNQSFKRPDIFSNISEGNDDNKNTESPKFQIDPNLFTIDGLDRFFDSVIGFIKTGEAWQWVKNWLKKSNIDLPIFYAGVGIIFFIFAELIFTLGIMAVIVYFSVKKIKAYRNKNPGFGSSTSPIYTPQNLVYSTNNFGISDFVQPSFSKMMQGLFVPALKQVGKFLWYLFLFLVLVGAIIYEYFLPIDVKKQIETLIPKNSIFNK